MMSTICIASLEKRGERARLLRIDQTPLLLRNIKRYFADKVVSVLNKSDPLVTSFTQLTTILSHAAKRCFPYENDMLLHGLKQVKTFFIQLFSVAMWR